MKFFSILSVLGSSIIVGFYMAFGPIRKYRHLEIVCYISINDFFFSVGTMLGYLRTGTAACWYQGLSSNYNSLSSAMWTAVMSHQLLSVVSGGSMIQDMTFPHLLCWGFPLLTSMAVFTTNSYGNPEAGAGWCFITSKPNSPSYGVVFWEVMSFYAWLWLSILLILFNYFKIMRRVYAIRLDLTSKESVKNLLRMSLYPLTLIACWTANTVENLFVEAGGNRNQPSNEDNSRGFATVLPTLAGALNCLAFFATTKLARQEIGKIFCGRYAHCVDCNGGEDGDGEARQDNPSSEPEENRGIREPIAPALPMQVRDSGREYTTIASSISSFTTNLMHWLPERRSSRGGDSDSAGNRGLTAVSRDTDGRWTVSGATSSPLTEKMPRQSDPAMT